MSSEGFAAFRRALLAERSIALIVALALLGWTAAWRLERSDNWGEQMVLYPDPVEYAAAARSLAEEGKFVLHLGPIDVRPMYSPGFPLLLAPFSAVGVPGDRLWRPAALFGWPLAAALALVVMRWACRGEARLAPGRRVAIAAVAFAAGAVWAASPFVWNFANKLLSEEAALSAALLAVSALVFALRQPGAGSRAAFVVAGSALLALVAIRPVNAVLLVVGCAPLAAWFWRRLGFRQGLAASGWLLAGALLVAVPVGLLLDHSGFSPWRWTAYGFWSPPDKIPGIVDFDWSYAWEGNPLRPRGEGQPLEPHAKVAAFSLLGIPGLTPWHYSGTFWPVLGLGALLLWARRTAAGSLERAVARSLVLWIAAIGILFLFYSWPLVRYLAAVHWLILAGTFATIARFAAAGRPWRPIAALLIALLCAGSTLQQIYRLSAVRNPARDENSATREGVAAWLARSDDERQGAKLPFDPARAQALGMLDRATRQRVGCWGFPIDRYHWVRLRDTGMLRLDETRRLRLAPESAPYVRRVDLCSAPEPGAASITETEP